jgi:Tfp pilus assembly protein PilE
MQINSRHTDAWTLMELFTVIAVIAILLGIAYPAFSLVMERARKTQAKNDLTQIITAVNAYYTEYGKYPLVAVAADTIYGSGGTPNGDLFYTLRAVALGANAADVANPRKIVFISPPDAKDQTNSRSGIKTSDGQWYDPWGSPYNIEIDGDYNNQVANPYGGSGGAGSDPINLEVIAWALGKNGVLGGGAPAAGFTNEPGTAGNFSGSGDVISWQ